MPRPPGGTKLLADAMLGSLARKLRAVGFDTLYFRSGPDSELLAEAKEGGRVILSSDRSLVATARRIGLPALLLTGRRDTVRMRRLVEGSKELGLALVRGDPLCSLCNGSLRTLKRDELAGRAPDGVAARHRLFYECLDCGKVYWKGGHWKKLRSFVVPLREE